MCYQKAATKSIKETSPNYRINVSYTLGTREMLVQDKLVENFLAFNQRITNYCRQQKSIKKNSIIEWLESAADQPIWWKKRKSHLLHATKAAREYNQQAC